MDKLVWVALGGGAGAAVRYALGAQAVRWFGADWPWGTLLINVSGSLAIGLLMGALHGRGAAAEPWWPLLGVGVLGGFTTFSTFSLEAGVMLLSGRWVAAGAYALASTGLSVTGFLLGLLATRG